MAQQEFPGFLPVRHDSHAGAGGFNVNAQGSTTPAELHKLLSRLLDDHQRIYPHQAHLCPLCQDTVSTLGQLADESPDDISPVDCAGDSAAALNSLS